ncbi:MAG: hypothetical protein HUU48_11480 [Flavobacteriales bacterium]|nr:hypothetical protein [Flavobacteriales bacterium]
MQKAFFLFLTFMGFFSITEAQMLDARKSLFSDMPFFREEFIRKNQIKSFYGKVSTKKELDIIRSKGEYMHFEFYENGLLAKQFKVFGLSNGSKDTLLIMYLYDSNNRINRVLKTDANGYYGNEYTFDTSGNIIKQTYCRYENSNPSKVNFEMEKRYEISSETYTYTQLTSTQVKKKYYNAYGNIYREDIINTNANGYLISSDAIYIIGNNRFSYVYTYNEKGLLAKLTEEAVADVISVTETTYKYDEAGNLLEENIFKNGKHSTVKQYLLDEKTMLVKATLVKEVSTNLITIFEYKYLFY